MNFRNDIGIADEDSVYFSEVSPSADSLSRREYLYFVDEKNLTKFHNSRLPLLFTDGSLISTFTSSSTASTLSDENTKSWLPAVS